MKQKNLLTYSKADVETGKVPVNELLSNSVFYPACSTDGRPIKLLNPRYAEFGIDSYVYADYAVGEERLAEVMDGLKHYHVFATRNLVQSDLYEGGPDLSVAGSLLAPDEKKSYKEAFRYYSKNVRPFGKWIVYERDADAGDEVGAERISLLYVGGEGAATYAALYLSRGVAPRVVTLINPGIAFGGNYSCFYRVLSKMIDSGKQLPEYLLSGSGDISAADCSLEGYERGIICKSH